MAGALRVYFLTTYVVFWQELKKGLVAYLPVRFGIEQRPSDRQA